MIVRKKMRREKDEKNKIYLIHELVQRKDKKKYKREKCVFLPLLVWFNTKRDERNVIEEKRNI